MNPSGLTFSRILGGAYKTLTIANQVIPLYRQVSPMIKNARNAFSIINEINKSNKKEKKNIGFNNVKLQTKNVVSQKKELSLNNPIFFI